MDPIANFLTSIRNANMKRHEKTDVPFSKVKMAIAKVLKDEGYIAGYRLMEENRMPFLRVQLRYTEAKDPVISGIRRVSRPGLRVYQGWDEALRLRAGMGISILSTPNGILANRKAKQMRCGGEVLCYVW